LGVGLGVLTRSSETGCHPRGAWRKRFGQIDPLTEETFVVGDELVRGPTRVRPQAGVRQRIALQPAERIQQVPPIRPRRVGRLQAFVLEHTALHQHSSRRSVSPIRGDVIWVPVDQPFESVPRPADRSAECARDGAGELPQLVGPVGQSHRTR
jgi:hypothetical protein